MPAYNERLLEGGRGIRIILFLRPATGLVAAADALAGYVIASPAAVTGAGALAVAPLLAASALLLVTAANVFAVAFAHASGKRPAGRTGELCDAFAEAAERGELTLRGLFLPGAALAAGGLFAAMAAAVFAGRLPVYFAAAIFLVSWARAGSGAGMSVLGPVSAGAIRAGALGLGMSAQPDLIYLTSYRPALGAALFFALGALVVAIEHLEGEGGRRFLLVGALGGLAAVFVCAGYFLVETPLAWIVWSVGAAAFVASGGAALRTLVPADVRRFADAALVSGFFLNSALCLGRWEARGVVLLLGGLALALVIPGAMMLARSSAGRHAPAG